MREAAEAGRDDAELWRELGELGWPGIAIAEEHGGQGLGVVELAILLEELGYACAATPFLGTALAGLAHPGRRVADEQRARWLPGLASGELRGGLAAPGLDRRRRRRRRAGARRRRRSCGSWLGDGRRCRASAWTRSTRPAGTRAWRDAAAGEPLPRRRRPSPRDLAARAVAAELVGDRASARWR